MTVIAAKAAAINMGNVAVRFRGYAGVFGMYRSAVAVTARAAAVYGTRIPADGTKYRRGSVIGISVTVAVHVRADIAGSTGGLGGAGSRGVRRAMQLLRDEIERDMVLMGCAKLADLKPSMVAR